jgi:hypothetical protein
MRTKLFLSVALSLCLCAASTAQTLPAYLPTDGLVGWWPFNGNANDESGNGNDGVVNGATLTEDRFGLANAAFDFNGNAFVEVQHSNSLSIAEAMTFSLWFKQGIMGNTINYLIQKGSGGGCSNTGLHIAVDYNFGLAENGYKTLQFGQNTNCAGIGSDIFLNENWHSMISVYNPSFGHKMYIDGNLVAEGFPYGCPDCIITNENTPMRIGALYSANGGFNWNGQIDDIAIYNRALSPEEITALYTGEPANPTTACNPLPSNLQNGLVGYWPFCGNANDESGNGNDGVVNGATLTEDRFGVANAAYDFDGVDDFIYTQIDSALEQDWSVNFWFKSTNPNNNFQGQNLIGLGPDVYGYGSAGLQISGQIEPGQCPSFAYLNQLYLFDASEECGGNFLNGGLYDSSQWHNVSILKNNLEYEIIIDNMSVSTAVLNDININEIALGNRSDLIFQYFRGALDDIAIYNRALSPEEVQQLYTLNACTFTIYDTLTTTLTETVFDTVMVTETIFDTITVTETIIDTIFVTETLIDTVTVTETLFVTVYDTVLTTVTDTLIINTLITELAPPANTNTIKVFPNPAGSTLSIDYGNYALMNGYQLRIENSLGQQVFQTNINQQSDTLNLGSWGGNGLYFVHIVDPQGNTIDIRKIVLQ